MDINFKMKTIFVLCLVSIHIYSFAGSESFRAPNMRSFGGQSTQSQKTIIFRGSKPSQSFELQRERIEKNNNEQFYIQQPKQHELYDFREMKEGPGTQGNGNINAMIISQNLLLLKNFINNDEYFLSQPKIIEIINTNLHGIHFVPLTSGKQSNEFQVDAKNYPVFKEIEVSEHMMKMLSELSPKSISFLAHEVFLVLGLNDSNYELSGYIYRMLQSQHYHFSKLSGYFVQDSILENQCHSALEITPHATHLNIQIELNCGQSLQKENVKYFCRGNECNLEKGKKTVFGFNTLVKVSYTQLYLLNKTSGKFLTFKQGGLK